MSTIIFSKPVAFPTAPLREMLTKHLPLYRWQCGEGDTGAPEQMGSFAYAPLISGRSDKTVVFVETRPFVGQLATPAPPHDWYLRVGPPTTDLAPVADRVTLLVCMTSMILDEDHAHCQLTDDGPWLTAPELLRLFKLVLAGEPLATVAAGIGKPPAAFAEGTAAAPSHPTALATASPEARPGGELPALVVLADRALPIDGASLGRMARDIDPDGGWQVEEHRGQPVLVGRKTVVGVLGMPMPLPGHYWQGNWARSHWFAGDRAAVERHTRHITVKAMLDMRRADWADIRQVAKVAQLAACWIARQPGALAIVNLDVGTTFEAARGRQFLQHLGHDQLSVALWSWTKVHGDDDGDVSLSTSGLRPFLGHELEMWHAPLPYEEAGTVTGDLIRYLLDHGPVIGHNDTAGRTTGDKSIRCFLGTSRAERPVPVAALVLEVDAPAVTAPKPDLPEPARTPLGDGVAAVMRQFAASPDVHPALRQVFGEQLAQDQAVKDAARLLRGQPDTGRDVTATRRPDSPPAPPLRRAGGFGRKGL